MIKSIQLQNEYVRKVVDEDNNVLFEANTKNIEREIAVSTPISGIEARDAAVIKEIKGNTVVWNQLIRDGNFPSRDNWTTAGSTLTVADGIATIEITSTAVTAGIRPAGIALEIGHKYLFVCDVRYTHGSSSDFALYNGTISSSPYRLGAVGAEWVTKSTVVTSGGYGTAATLQIRCNQDGGTVGDICQIKNAMFIDLTVLYGARKEPSTIAEFRATYPLDYYDYNSGEPLNFTGTGIIAKKNGAVVGSTTLPITTYFLDGMRSNDDTYDSLTATKAIQRIASDGTTLAEPIETPIDPPLDLHYIVENDGTESITAEGTTSPFKGTVEYVVPDIDIEVVPQTFTENGTYTAAAGTAYSPVTVNVPNPSTGKLNITDTQVKDVSTYAEAQVIDENLVAENIKNGVTILGVTGTHQGGAVEPYIEETYNSSKKLTTISLHGHTYVPDKKFSSQTSLTTVTFPNTVTSIGTSSFYACSALTTLNSLPEGLITIGD